MDLNITVPPGDDTRGENCRHLPTYDAANTQYTLRLPTYRSSYIRRFHPYARIARFIEEQDVVRRVNFLLQYACPLTWKKDESDNEQRGEGMLLDLRLLRDPVEVLLPTASDEHSEGNLNKVPAEESPVGEVPVVIGSVIANASL